MFYTLEDYFLCGLILSLVTKDKGLDPAISCTDSNEITHMSMACRIGPHLSYKLGKFNSVGILHSLILVLY